MNAITKLKISRIKSWGFSEFGRFMHRKAPNGWTEIVDVYSPDVIKLYSTLDFMTEPDEVFHINWDLHITMEDKFKAVLQHSIDDREELAALEAYVQSR